MVFPYGEARKYRKGFEKDAEGGRKFWWDPPTQAGQVPFLPPDFEPREWMLLCEGETDTMALWQALPAEAREKVSVVGLSGTNAWKAEYAESLFGQAKTVFVLFDNDDPYENADAVKQTDKAWRTIRHDLGRKARRVKLPQGSNDLAEFFQTYDWAALRHLLGKAAKPNMPFGRLDLSRDPGPLDWLVEGMLVSPDISLLYGNGGVSKSLLLQQLAVAVVDGHETFLGMPLRKHGRVLYVDEENPEDVVLGRLRKLGLTEAGREKLWYAWYERIRLDVKPEVLYEAVQEFDPVLVCIDSFSRVQLAGENGTDEMNALFTNAIYPVARELKVPIVALHHANRSGQIRGNLAIRNAADLSLEITKAKTSGGQELLNTYTVFTDKPRRGQSPHITYRVVGYGSDGEPTDNLDQEVRIHLEREEHERPEDVI